MGQLTQGHGRCDPASLKAGSISHSLGADALPLSGHFSMVDVPCLEPAHPEGCQAAGSALASCPVPPPRPEVCVLSNLSGVSTLFL